MKDLTFRLVKREHTNTEKTSLEGYTLKNARLVRQFHESFPMYAPTPLARLTNTAKKLGIGDIYVKDESHRFGLNAFKVLGGSYAMGNILARQLGRTLAETGYDVLTSPETRKTLGDITFITATDGNHGRGVAWTATTLGQRSVVHMPKGSAPERLHNIQAAGAQADIIDGNYDDAVRLSRKEAAENGWVVVQDTSWPGYEEIPGWIMQGYCTMGLESYEQLPEKPTHIFLQAGVGSMAAAIAALYADLYGEERPRVIIVEPNAADCFYRTAAADDGQMHIVTGEMKTIMAGLACGEPCSLAWDLLKDYADFFLAFPDWAAAKGMRILGNPMPGDVRVTSGESGASAFGAVAAILTEPELSGIKEELGLDENSRVLFFSTEGDTDRENYRKIVWEGKFPG
ncbi:MAG: diaminopropionate ammonia-lyase [Oscillospiraceae bacterium]